MKNGLLLLFVFSVFVSTNLIAKNSNYAGSQKCSECHSEQYNSFIASGHPYKLSKASEAKTRGLPLPKGYTWDDISYVIGGAYKKSRYIDKKGYIITGAKDGSALKTQYNIETGTWSYYHKGEKKKYSCGGCHTTGYKKEGNQDNLEGMVGTWASAGVQCEACHGAGAKHVKSKKASDIVVDKKSSLCGKCHVRGSKDQIPAKGNFIRHHEQFNEILAGPHKLLNCVSCHDPHKRAKFGIRKACTTCHMDKKKVNHIGKTSCVDCHMARVTKSAVAKSKIEGDVRTHLFKINSDPKANMFYKKGKKLFSKGFITLKYACLGCHETRDIKWASKNAKKIHK